MTQRRHLYLGKAGHLAMMAEFLLRGWNVAIPEVDVGDDIFVVQDENGTLRRVQVKTSTAKSSQRGHGARYQIQKRQVLDLSIPIVHFAFMARSKEDWFPPILIRQDVLKDFVEKEKIGVIFKNQVTLYFSFRKGRVMCGHLDFTPYVADYQDFPIIHH